MKVSGTMYIKGGQIANSVEEADFLTIQKSKYPNLEKAQLQDALAKSEFCGNVIDSKPKNKAGEIDEENGVSKCFVIWKPSKDYEFDVIV